jgi:hypothetical protein
MVYSLNYRRPSLVIASSRTSLDSEREKGTSSDGSIRTGKISIPGIPDALAFDKIIDGGTCPPCTVRDFMNYLLYVEHSAENLQFFLWFRDFSKRFDEANTSDIHLAPEWTQAQQDDAVVTARALVSAKKASSKPFGAGTISTVKPPSSASFVKPPSSSARDSSDPFNTPPRTPGDQSSNRDAALPWNSKAQSVSEKGSSYQSSNTESYRQVAGDAFKAAGLKQPFTIQPFREEIDRVIVTYIIQNSPRELNISDRERYTILRALEVTTHPTAFKELVQSVESTLRRQSHPNFIRWTICNGNRSRVIFARGLGITLILAGLVLAIVLTLSKLGRGWRALAAIAWVIGISTLVAAYKGMCVVLHGMHHRHLRPWELFEDPEENKKSSFESFNSANSYEDEPWVVKYKKRNIIRKIFDREVWIQEPALRQIQDTIFIQSMLSALLLAAVLTAVFVAVPKGGFY